MVTLPRNPFDEFRKRVRRMFEEFDKEFNRNLSDTNEAYFATFELPPDANPESRSLELKEEVLTVKIPRRKNA